MPFTLPLFNINMCNLICIFQAFGYFAMFVYMYNAFLAFRIWWSARKEARNQATAQPTGDPQSPSEFKY